ncbi:CwfJ-like family protein, partial [Perilla frutescens var. frutescens]
MLSGLKFIPRDNIDEEKDGKSYDSRKEKRKSARRKEKLGRRNKHSRYSSSDDEGLERIKSGSRKKKKWYDSEEDLSSFSNKSGGESESERDQKRHRSRKGEKEKRDDISDKEHKSRSKKKAKRQRGEYSSESDFESESSSKEGGHHKGSQLKDSNNILREEMGLGWMLRPNNSDEISSKSPLIEPGKASVEEIKKDDSRELNPYLKNNGTGYPEESDGMKVGEKRLLSSAVIGDGGASWRLKALKRAEEQATREGRNLQE